MKKMEFSIEINAPKEKVYNLMLGLEDIKTYEHWTAEFNPTSTYEGSWEKGSKIYFIGTDENGNRGGMVSEIAENIPGRFVSIRHNGILKGETEITEGPEVDSWAGGLEDYKFEEHKGVTTLTISMDTPQDHADFFYNTYPKALNRLKDLAENKS